MISFNIPIVVEGKYDKARLVSMVESVIITTDGFGVFKSPEKRALIRRLAEKNGIFVLTDADGAGLVIRNLLRGCVPKEKITHLYIPAVAGKERRKAAPSKEGLLGVEGIDEQTLTRIFAPFAVDADVSDAVPRNPVTKADFFAAGLSGGQGSAERRGKLAEALRLPPHMSANALLEAINLLYSKEDYEAALSSVCEEDVTP